MQRSVTRVLFLATLLAFAIPCRAQSIVVLEPRAGEVIEIGGTFALRVSFAGLSGDLDAFLVRGTVVVGRIAARINHAPGGADRVESSGTRSVRWEVDGRLADGSRYGTGDDYRILLRHGSDPPAQAWSGRFTITEQAKSAITETASGGRTAMGHPDLTNGSEARAVGQVPGGPEEEKR